MTSYFSPPDFTGGGLTSLADSLGLNWSSSAAVGSTTAPPGPQDSTASGIASTALPAAAAASATQPTVAVKQAATGAAGTAAAATVDELTAQLSQLTFKLAAKDALLDGLRSDLNASRREAALATKEAEVTAAQLAQRDAELATNHRALLKLDELRASSSGQQSAVDALKAQISSQDSAMEALRADNSRLKKALAAREAAARHSEGSTPRYAVGEENHQAGGAPREMLAKLSEMTGQLASREMQLQTLRAELADARRAAADAEVAASAAKRATATSRVEADTLVAAARTAAAERAVAVTSLPNGGMGATHAELLAALAARDVHLAAMQSELSVARGIASQVGRDKDRMVSELAAIEQRLLDELASAKEAHQAAQQSAEELANNAAEVMTALSAQLDAERTARETAERQLEEYLAAEDGHAAGGAHPARNREMASGAHQYDVGMAPHQQHAQRSGQSHARSGGKSQGPERSRTPGASSDNGALVAPGVLRGVAAGVLAGLAARWAMSSLGGLGGRVKDRTGTSRNPPRSRAEGQGAVRRV